ncbi:NAD(P)/FAD-dependent oxidoreductase [Deminuibacter soli]|uniref:FAD-binding oxidoreductase n=1 Tax=Deminuibacter soli TaxID=2291815 RepID=A0A3E1NID8_9BACT|nr:FAD-dependent oxidoreductase [Deminuibacter soli]RFM27584.1 FAD-binding oxidoreductase [Deminuibacter soli]
MQISYWEQTAFYAHRDIIITGAGLQGLWCAYALKKARPSLNILILEQMPVSYGASTRNAGFACFGSATELLHDARTAGEDAMLQQAERRYKGMQLIKELLGDKIDYVPCGGYECLSNQLQPVAEIVEQLPWLNQALHPLTGNPEVFSLTNNRLHTQGLTGFDALVYNPLEAALHSGKLVQCLQQLVREMGVEIINGITVTGCTPSGRGIELQSNQQLRFTATQALFCINAFTPQLFPEVNIIPGRGQILLTDPIEGLALNGTFHFDEGYYYFRNLGNRILLGGARNTAFAAEQTTDIAVSDEIQTVLEAFLNRHFITARPVTIAQRWAGIMGFTANKQPLLQQTQRGAWVVSACNGMGVALSPIMAQVVAERLTKY